MAVLFDTVLIIHNPRSSSNSRSQKIIQNIQENYPKKSIVVHELSQSSKNVREALRRNSKILGPRTIIGICGGDGTVSATVSNILNDKQLPKKARQSVLLPLWGGNANDLAYMLNGLYSQTNIKKIIESGTVVSIRPLCVLLASRSHKRLYTATCYASFGVSAKTAVSVNKLSHRKNIKKTNPLFVFVRETVMVVRNFLTASLVTIEDHGRKQTVIEYAIINGSRWGKINRIPIKITDKSYFIAQFESPKLTSILQDLAAIQLKKAGSIKTGETSFVIKNQTAAQIDGEVIELRPNTKITVTPHPLKIRVLSTK